MSDRLGQLPFPENQVRKAVDENGNRRYTESDGAEYIVSDHDYSVDDNPMGSGVLRTGFRRRIRCVYNDTANTTFYGKYLVQFSTADRKFGTHIVGYAVDANGHGYPLSEWTPPQGLPPGHQGWVVTGGPAMCITSVAGDAGNVIGVGAPVGVDGAASSQQTASAGRVAAPDFAHTQAALANAVLNVIGRALEAKTTGNTNSDMLVLVASRW